MFLVSTGLLVSPSMHPFVKLKDNVTLYYCIIAIIKKVFKIKVIVRVQVFVEQIVLTLLLGVSWYVKIKSYEC